VFRGSASRPRSGTLSSMGGRSFGSSADRANTDLHSGSLIESQPQFRAGLPSELEVGFQPSLTVAWVPLNLSLHRSVLTDLHQLYQN